MPDQQRDVALKRAWLQERIDAFQRQVANILQSAFDGGDDSWDGTLGRETYLGTEFDGISEEDQDNEGPSSAEEHDQIQLFRNYPTDGRVDAEYISLHLPSCLERSWCNRNAAKDLAKAELRLSEGQLNDSLHHI